MKGSGGDSKARIQKHRLRRKDMGFITIEKQASIGNIVNMSEIFDTDADTSDGVCILLECVSNLLANEMYDRETDGERSVSDICEGILSDIDKLVRRSELFVAVSNDIFSDGVAYTKSVREYMRALGYINRRLAATADEAYEVTSGIALRIK